MFVVLFRKRRNNQMTAVKLQVNPSSFLQIFQKTSYFISANTYGKYILSKDNCIARHDDKMCFFPNCRYLILLIGNLKDLLQKLDAFCFNYQNVGCFVKKNLCKLTNFWIPKRFVEINWYCKRYSHHTHQEPKCHKERNNPKDSTKRETNTCYTLVKSLFTAGRRHYPTSCSLMSLAFWWQFSEILKRWFGKPILNKKFWNVSDFKIEKNRTRQILDWRKYNALDSEFKNFRHVRFWFKKFNNASDFILKIFQS